MRWPSVTWAATRSSVKPLITEGFSMAEAWIVASTLHSQNSEELQTLAQRRRAELGLQMPSFIRGDEDEDAEDLFFV